MRACLTSSLKVSPSLTTFPHVFLPAYRVAEERASDFSYSFKASILEIYNEQIFDLLLSGKEQDDKLDIKQVWKMCGRTKTG